MKYGTCISYAVILSISPRQVDMLHVINVADESARMLTASEIHANSISLPLPHYFSPTSVINNFFKFS